MANGDNILEAPIPRPLLCIGTPIAAIVLITVLVFLRFPYDEFARPLEQRLSAATGADVTIGHIEPQITIGGPGVAIREIWIVTPGRQRVAIDPLRIRPAWSTRWLRGDPTFKLEVMSPIGRADGFMVLGEDPAWTGSVQDLDLAMLPLPGSLGLGLAGHLTIAADLEGTSEGLRGPLSFDAVNGTISHSTIPIPLEFERASGDLVLGDDTMVAIKSFEIEGPILFASITGSVARAQSAGDAPLDLDIEIEIKNPVMQEMMRSAGLSLDARGRAQFKLGGTPSAPRLR